MSIMGSPTLDPDPDPNGEKYSSDQDPDNNLCGSETLLCSLKAMKGICPKWPNARTQITSMAMIKY